MILKSCPVLAKGGLTLKDPQLDTRLEIRMGGQCHGALGGNGSVALLTKREVAAQNSACNQR